MNNLKKRIARITAFLLTVSVACPLFILSPLVAEAWYTPNDDPLIVVSLGDSYSSGEGNEDFIGQKDADGKERSLQEKADNNDWLAHRSENSWAGMLHFDGWMPKGKTLNDYNVDAEKASTSSNVQWYFRASSGAKTEQLTGTKDNPNGEHEKKVVDKQGKTVNKKNLPNQLSVFDDYMLYGKVDYVTITIGGNDVGFVDILQACIMNDAIIDYGSRLELLGWETGNLLKMIQEVMDDPTAVMNKLINAYKAIEDAAGKQAAIIVAGYPKLVKGGNCIITQSEATLINSSVTYFNGLIKTTVEGCRDNLGMNIYYVDVEKEFEGHEAHLITFIEGNEHGDWIHSLIIPPKEQDLDQTLPNSAYSFHPNHYGVKMYAELVSKVIQEIENNKSKPHEHQFSSTWSNDKTYHWRECTGCDEVTDKEKHKFGEWTVTKQATETSTGSKERKCTVCGYKQKETIAKTKHTHVWSYMTYGPKWDEVEYYSGEEISTLYCVCGSMTILKTRPFSSWGYTDKECWYISIGFDDSVLDSPFYDKEDEILTIPYINFESYQYVGSLDKPYSEWDQDDFQGNETNVTSLDFSSMSLTALSHIITIDLTNSCVNNLVMPEYVEIDEVVAEHLTSGIYYTERFINIFYNDFCIAIKKAENQHIQISSEGY